ncbi:MAG: zinc ribbon domain-containing protein [Chloroflexota bacterium]
MKNIWKWVLGISIVLLLLIAAGLGVRYLSGAMLRPALDNFDGDMRTPRFERGENFLAPVFDRDQAFLQPMMGARMPSGQMPSFSRFSPFPAMLPFGGSSTMLVPLLLLGLLIYGAYQLGKKSALPAGPAPAAAAHAPERNCAKCARPVQDDWKACPYCGKKF